MEERKIVTIDLGTRKLQLCVAHSTLNGKIEVEYCKDFPSDGIARGKVQNPTRLSEALKTAICDAEAALGIKITDLMAGCQKYDIRQMDNEARIDLSQDDCICRQNLAELESLADCQAHDQLNEDEEILALVSQSFGTQDEIGLKAEEINGMMGDCLCGNYKVFAGKTAVSKSIDKAFSLQGSKLIHKGFAPAETGLSVLNENEMETGVALVDFGAGSTSVSIFCGGTLRHYGAVPFGGNTITSDIHNLCGISDTLAENIKKAYGGCMPDKLESLGEKTIRIKDCVSDARTEITAKYLSEIITARTREILDAVLYEIQCSGYADKLKNGIVLVGGCAPMLNLCNLVKQMSGYNARLGAPSHTIFESEEKAFFSCSCASSAGLLIKLMNIDGLSCTGEAVARHESVLPGETVEITDNGTVKTPKPDNGPFSDDEYGKAGLFGGLFGSGKKEKAPKKPKEPKAPKAQAVPKETESGEIGGLFDRFMDGMDKIFVGGEEDELLNKL